MRLLMRTSIVLALSASIACGCSCSPPITAWIASVNSDVVFRGTIAAIREDTTLSSGAGAIRYTRRIAVFRVTRVWKGAVGLTVEITAPEESLPCMGYEPSYFKVGNDLLVYAKGTSEYSITSCSRTSLAKDAKADFEELDSAESKPRKLDSK